VKIEGDSLFTKRIFLAPLPWAIIIEIEIGFEIGLALEHFNFDPDTDPDFDDGQVSNEIVEKRKRKNR
jgi:hypothetical protein